MKRGRYLGSSVVQNFIDELCRRDPSVKLFHAARDRLNPLSKGDRARPDVVVLDEFRQIPKERPCPVADGRNMNIPLCRLLVLGLATTP